MAKLAGRSNQPAASSLADAMSRLDSALAAAAAGRRAALGSSPERELLTTLGALARPGQPGHEPGLSFGLGRDAQARAEGLVDELLDSVRSRARIETARRGRVVASTAVSLGGDILTSLDPELEPEQRERHLDALDDHLRAQHERIELLLTVLQMASKIALAAGTGNPLLAVPTALRFIRGVMAERREIQASPP